MPAQYVIGIDLGTTNSVLAFAPLEGDRPDVSVLMVPQVVDASTIDSRMTLPSFAFLAADAQSKGGALDLPWAKKRKFCVGEFARRSAAEAPDRTVTAAKSWLCNSQVDRTAPILPWNAPDSVDKISPVVASQHYLEHLIATWKAAFPDAPIAEQQVVLTVPASFDAAARELTHQAALAAGLPDDLVLLEEPQAAVYAWLATQGDAWRKSLKVGDILLVCDVGGGTSDFTLIGVEDDSGDLTLKRMAVGNHLLVGGDNMDLALAHAVAGRFADEGVKLDPWQSVALWHSCRTAKETLLAPDGPDTHTISILGRGSKLIGGTVSTEIDAKMVSKLLVDGFLPKCDANDQPKKKKASGFQEIGLPFESDPAITHHLAAFLSGQSTDKDPIYPTRVLFNGGVFQAAALQDRLFKVIGDWSGDAKKTKLLDANHDLDHAVASGAAYYAWTKKLGGVRIRGGVARSYYVGIETAGLAIPGAPRPLRALCVVPFGMEEGTEVDVPSGEIGLVHGEPAEFRFFSSTTRKSDEPGSVIDGWDEDELIETSSMETTLPADKSVEEPYVPVQFQSKINELGMFELWCVSTQTDGRWKLEFNVRDED